MRGRIAVAGMALILALSVKMYAADFSTSVLAGYNGGLSFKATGNLSHFAQGFPLGVEFGIGHSRMDPGRPADARKVFINDATNGTPDESGWAWDFRLDFLYQVRLLGMQNAHVFVGVRRSYFTGHFSFIGGNEIFDITTSLWGWGAGLKAVFPMGTRVGFTLAAGFDHYPAGTIEGHDTSYSPNGESVNGREGYDYNSADEAINQPKFEGVLMAGITVSF